MHAWMLHAFDLVAIAAAPYIALFLRYDFEPSWDKVVALVPFASASVVAVAVALVVGRFHKTPWRHTGLAETVRFSYLIALGICAALIVAVYAKWINDVPRSVPPIQFVITLLLMSGMRVASWHLNALFDHFVEAKAESTQERPFEHILIVGRTLETDVYLQTLKRLSDKSVVVEGLLDDAPSSRGKIFCRHTVLGCPHELPEIMKQLAVHAVSVSRVVVALPLEKLSPLSRDVLLALEREGVVTLTRFNLELGAPAANAVTDIADFSEQVRAAADRIGLNADKTYAFIKRAVEIPLALVLIVLLAPLMLLVALLVAIDVGAPVIFWQERLGRMGRPFRIYKFRTMGPAYNSKGEALEMAQRTSRIGRLLRRSKCDELPQLFNILVGSMSFVGPRPLRRPLQPKNGEARLLVRPGLTGWAQIHGGHLLQAHEKLPLDIWYIRNCSFRVDVWIILATIRVVVRGVAVRLPDRFQTLQRE
jgi:lipopolysaccharide/colanic/teichoic acid biosynthesis glycosyltransferase